ncbi:hypothetical protein Tco_0549289 [Tanacetum coccineum]
MSTSASTQAVHLVVAWTQSAWLGINSDRRTKTQFAPVKAVEQSWNLWGGAAGQFNQANSGYRPPMVSIQFDLLVFLQFRILR